MQREKREQQQQKRIVREEFDALRQSRQQEIVESQVKILSRIQARKNAEAHRKADAAPHPRELFARRLAEDGAARRALDSRPYAYRVPRLDLHRSDE